MLPFLRSHLFIHAIKALAKNSHFFQSVFLSGSTVSPFTHMMHGATCGAELRTLKQLQGWSHFGSTFFSVRFYYYYMNGRKYEDGVPAIII